MLKKTRLRKHRSVRGKISGTPACPRLSVYRSTKHIYAQIIDDVNAVTLVAACTAEKDFGMTGGNKEAALSVTRLDGTRGVRRREGAHHGRKARRTDVRQRLSGRNLPRQRKSYGAAFL